MTADRVQRSYWMPKVMADAIEGEAARRSSIEGRRVYQWEIAVEAMARGGLPGGPPAVTAERTDARNALTRLETFLNGLVDSNDPASYRQAHADIDTILNHLQKGATAP